MTEGVSHHSLLIRTILLSSDMANNSTGDLAHFFKKNNLSYQQFDHPPVYTCEEVRNLNLRLPGVELKNLFLRDRKGARHFLLAVPAAKNVDLKALAGELGLSGMGFASAERLKEHLDLEAGAVTLLAAFNDRRNSVEILIDQEAWNSDFFQCHPLVNTSTWVVGRAELERFFKLTSHEPRIVAVPVRFE